VTLLIGVDGGGSGCRARIADGDRVLGEGVAGPAQVRLGVPTALAAALAAVEDARAAAGLAPERLASAAAAIGLAGFGRHGAIAAARAHPLPFARIAFATDSVVACLGAHAGGDGGVVVVGTGSSALALVAGREITVGGYGFPISDEGSGADLGLEAVRVALRAHDGRAPAGDLTRRVMAGFAGDPYRAVAWMDRATATDYAALAPLVVAAAEAGDPTAARLMAVAGAAVGGLVCGLVSAGAPKVALIGGLASAIVPWLPAEAARTVVAPLGDPLDGALRLAASVSGSPPDSPR
jgi:glucosamine kinase